MATLVYSDVDGVDRSFALGSDQVLVGRGPECAIRSEDPRVSRQHARFFLDSGTLWVEDLGSSNGIFVGPNKVQRAPVPTGEIILVGSLMIRLLPASGTLPPPMGLHGTLASWLDLERKTRAAVEEERDAFAKRVGELHQQIAAIKLPDTIPPDATSPTGMSAEAIRLRDEADARAAALERALAAVQDEVMTLRQQGAGGRMPFSDDEADETVLVRGEVGELRAKVRELEQELAEHASWSSNIDVESTKLLKEVSRLQSAYTDAQSAQAGAERAQAESHREAQELRAELDGLRRTSAAEVEIARLEVNKSRESKMMAETAVGITTAEKLAEADLVVSSLRRELADAKAAQAGPDARAQGLAEQITTLTAKTEKLEKELAAAQIRAQGAERNLSGATAQAAKAETRAAQLEQKVSDSEDRVKSAEHDVAKALERAAALETRLGAGDAPVQAAEARAAKIAAELAEMTSQFDTRRDRLVELEKELFATGEAAKTAEATAAKAKAETAEVATKLADAEKRAAEFKARVDQLATADSAIAAATKARDEAAAKSAGADKRVTDAERRAADAEQRASAADTMAKAMAKDVAEALRRAADVDSRSKGAYRDLAEATKRVEQAEAKSSDGASSNKELESRAAAAEARIVQIQTELGAQLEAAQKALSAKLDAAQNELTTKLDATQRELAAERSTSIAIIDRKTSVERELAEARTTMPALQQRAEAAEQRAVEAEVQIETLQERITDLESGVAVSETAAMAGVEEARANVKRLEATLAETATAGAAATAVTDKLVARVAELEGHLAQATATRDTVEAALAAAHARIADLEQTVARAGDAESKFGAISAKAEAADLAIGRASALQRQLDESLSKLAWLEREAAAAKSRDQKSADQSEAAVAERLTAAESHVKESEARLRDAETRARDAEVRLRSVEANLETSVEEIAETQRTLAEVERRAQMAEQANRGAAGIEGRVREAETRAQGAEQTNKELERRIAEMIAKAGETSTRLAALQKEVDGAENVRSFAAETEREIAQLQRDLREARAKATQVTLERDRLESELKDARGDTDTTNRRLAAEPGGAKASFDPEVTVQADLKKYESMIAQSTDLQDKVQRLEREDAALRAQLASAEERLNTALAAIAAKPAQVVEADAESTRTGSQLPIVLVENVNILEESIDSLRANMRAASDETAMMDPSDSVTAVSSAVSQAQEHVERARAAIKQLVAAIGTTS